MAHNPFTHHPREVGESYGEHLAHAGVSGLRLVGIDGRPLAGKSMSAAAGALRSAISDGGPFG